MRPLILTLEIAEGTLFVGPPDSLSAYSAALPVDPSAYRSTLLEILMRRSTPWSVRNLLSGLDAATFSSRERTEHGLFEQILQLVETGRLTVCFLPLFRADVRESGQNRSAGRTEGGFPIEYLAYPYRISSQHLATPYTTPIQHLSTSYPTPSESAGGCVRITHSGGGSDRGAKATEQSG